MTNTPGLLSSQQMRHGNALAYLSKEPGNLDYNAYRQYLTKLGHVKPFYAGTTISNASDPQNSNLQTDHHDRFDNKTDFRTDQALWSQDNLPELIYAFDKPPDWLEKCFLNAPPLKQYEIYGTRLRDIPILPDHISSDVEGWRIEAWMRFDPRVSLQDIIERMPVGARPQNKSRIQMRTLRFREDCKILGWVALGKNYDARRQGLLREMVKRGINPKENSTRGLSWGLVNPMKGEAGGRIHVDEKRRIGSTVDMNGISTKHFSRTNDTGSPSALPSPSISRTAGSSRADTFEDYENNIINLLVGQDWRNVPRCVSTGRPSNLNRQLTDHNTVSTPARKPMAPPTPLSGSSRRSLLPSPQVSPLNFPSQIHNPYPRPIYRQPPPQRLPPRHLTNTQHTPTPTPSPTPTPTQPKDQSSDEKPLITIYDHKPLMLKTPLQRTQDIAYISRLNRQWHPYGSTGRRLQLAYMLDIDKIRAGKGWRDNRGWWPPVRYHVLSRTAQNETGEELDLITPEWGDEMGFGGGDMGLKGWECIDEDVIYL